jgi:hypothetical protein
VISTARDHPPQETNHMTKQTLSDPEIDEIEARANAATDGPWCTDSWEIYQGTEYVPGISMWIGETCRGSSTPEQDRADAAFVAAARTDVPALLAEVRRLRAQVAELEPDAALLAALYAGGVDNWDGYDDAREAAAPV